MAMVRYGTDKFLYWYLMVLASYSTGS